MLRQGVRRERGTLKIARVENPASMRVAADGLNDTLAKASVSRWSVWLRPCKTATHKPDHNAAVMQVTAAFVFPGRCGLVIRAAGPRMQAATVVGLSAPTSM